MSQNEMGSDPRRRVLLTRKADPFLTVGFAVSVGAGASLLYKVATAAVPASHVSLAITGLVLVVVGVMFLLAGGWRTLVL